MKDEEIEGAKQKQRAWTPKTLNLLSEKGSNLERVHSLVNVFHLSSEEAATELLSVLRAEGYEIAVFKKVTENDVVSYWTIHAAFDTIPLAEKVHEMTDACVELARSVGGEYDGWYTQPVSQ